MVRNQARIENLEGPGARAAIAEVTATG